MACPIPYGGHNYKIPSFTAKQRHKIIELIHQKLKAAVKVNG